jgi:hypothetical protein
MSAQRLRVARRPIVLGVAIVAVILALPGAASATEVSVTSLIEDGESFDGEVITVVGELVGDYGSRRDGFTWTQLNQDAYVEAPVVDGGPLVGGNVGIGVQIPTDLTTSFDPPGRYRQVGPIVAATGVWKYHDPQRQGESYLAVDGIEVLEQGRELSEPPDWIALTIGLALAVGAIAVLALRRRRAAV